MAQQPEQDPVSAQAEAVLDQYREFLRSTIARFAPRDVGIQVDDIEQEASISLWRALKRERKARHLASYLHRAAINATIDAIRRVKARRDEELEKGARLEDEPEEDNPLDVAAAALPPGLRERHGEIIDHVDRALAGMGEERRRAVGLYLQGFGSQDIADLLGWTEPRARNLIYRGLRGVRQQLEEHGIPYEFDY